MAPFEMLYGRRCQTPLFWNETREWMVFGPRHIARSQETSSYGERESARCVIKTEELC
jgi:hypothetical protein